MNIKKINEEVYYTEDSITKVDRSDIDFLKEKALGNERKRARLCSHLDGEDLLHEMLIVLVKGAEFPAHKHLGKSESFHIIEGEVKVIIYDESGKVKEEIEMGDYSSGKKFYYRLSGEEFHTVVPGSDVVVFHEITNGPFKDGDTVFSSWER
ncbi:WbuC family cupin fold metalloprotein [Candidatus Omnitrophota bacterium]